MIYKDFLRNHAIFPGREKALEEFLKQEYHGLRHKWKNGFNSNSEDALTWSCFDVLRNAPPSNKKAAIQELMEDAYAGSISDFEKYSADDIQIHIGKEYTGLTTKESTEVDASIELPDALVFIEAKLYSSLSGASPPEKPHDQIARKIRIGLDSPLGRYRKFYFIFLDIAPLEKMTERRKKAEAMSPTGAEYHDKWKSAWIFNYYKKGRNGSLKPLREAIAGIEITDIESVADNMGWLTWGDLFKTTLRSVLNS